MTAFEFRWRSFCALEGIQYKTGFSGEVWKWHYRNYHAQYTYNRDRAKIMMELAA